MQLTKRHTSINVTDKKLALTREMFRVLLDFTSASTPCMPNILIFGCCFGFRNVLVTDTFQPQEYRFLQT